MIIFDFQEKETHTNKMFFQKTLHTIKKNNNFIPPKQKDIK